MYFMRFKYWGASFFYIDVVGSLYIGKGSPLSSHLEAKAIVVAMSSTVCRFWDKMWLTPKVHKLLWNENILRQIY